MESFTVYLFKKVIDAHRSSQLIESFIRTYDLEIPFLDKLIEDSFVFGRELLIWLLAGMLTLLLFLWLMWNAPTKKSCRLIPLYSLFVLVISSWFFIPLAIIFSIQYPPHQYLTVERGNIPESDYALLSFNVIELDKYRWFCFSLFMGNRILIFLTLMFFSSLCLTIDNLPSILRYAFILSPLIYFAIDNFFIRLPVIEYIKGAEIYPKTEIGTEALFFESIYNISRCLSVILYVALIFTLSRRKKERAV